MNPQKQMKKHYLKLARKDLLTIASLNGTNEARFKKLKRRAAKNIEIAKSFERI